MDNPAQRAPDAPLKNAILIAGPTASGKSALALELARQTGGVIINADSMQVYGVLRVLTARPDGEDLAAAPHLLYGHVDPRDAYSTGRWLRDLAALEGSGARDGRRPILVGGTGLYFSAATEGLSEIPPVPLPVRERWRSRLAQDGASALHEVLVRDDPVAGAAIRPSDGQRIVRALEVLEASGRPISAWHARSGTPLVDRGSARCFVIEPDRRVLAERIAQRFDAMVAEGALDEVRAMMDLELDPALPAAKAIGLRELSAAIRGETSVADATERARIATRQYAKRQSTWFRNRLGADWKRIGLGEFPDLT